MPPDLVDVTVEKVAIAAVMAGCNPEYLPWVLTAVEAICNDEFNIHGVLATTMPVGPVIICSGPGTQAIGMNGAGNALGQGNRANLTIGRALQLVVRNVGGGRPGRRPGHPRQPGQARRSASARSTRLAVRRRSPSPAAPRRASTRSRCSPARARVRRRPAVAEPESLARSLAVRLQTVHHPKLVLGFDAILVLGPEHGRVFAEAGWDREQIARRDRSRA